MKEHRPRSYTFSMGEWMDAVLAQLAFLSMIQLSMLQNTAQTHYFTFHATVTSYETCQGRHDACLHLSLFELCHSRQILYKSSTKGTYLEEGVSSKVPMILEVKLKAQSMLLTLHH